MKALGIALIVLGLLTLVYSGISIPLAPIVGGIAIVGGLLLLVVPRGRAA